MDSQHTPFKNPDSEAPDPDAARMNFLASMGLGDLDDEPQEEAPSNEVEEEPEQEREDSVALSSQPDDLELPGAEAQSPVRVPVVASEPAPAPSKLKVTARVASGVAAPRISVVGPSAEQEDDKEEEVLVSKVNEISAKIEVAEPAVESESAVIPEPVATESTVSLEGPHVAVVDQPSAFEAISVDHGGGDGGEPQDRSNETVEPSESVEDGVEDEVEAIVDEKGDEPAAEEVQDREAEESVAVEVKSETEAAEEGPLQLACPKCKEELILFQEHVGVEGACVWCGTKIVAARSGADGEVRVFPLFQPDAVQPAPISQPVEADEEEVVAEEPAIEDEMVEDIVADEAEATAAAESESGEVEASEQAAPADQSGEGFAMSAGFGPIDSDAEPVAAEIIEPGEEPAKDDALEVAAESPQPTSDEPEAANGFSTGFGGFPGQADSGNWGNEMPRFSSAPASEASEGSLAESDEETFAVEAEIVSDEAASDGFSSGFTTADESSESQPSADTGFGAGESGFANSWSAGAPSDSPAEEASAAGFSSPFGNSESADAGQETNETNETSADGGFAAASSWATPSSDADSATPSDQSNTVDELHEASPFSQGASSFQTGFSESAASEPFSSTDEKPKLWGTEDNAATNWGDTVGEADDAAPSFQEAGTAPASIVADDDASSPEGEAESAESSQFSTEAADRSEPGTMSDLFSQPRPDKPLFAEASSETKGEEAAPNATPEPERSMPAESTGATASTTVTEGSPTVTSQPLKSNTPSGKRKGMGVLFVMVLGLVCGVAAASFLLPVEDYAAKARSFIEQKLNGEAEVDPAQMLSELATPNGGGEAGDLDVPIGKVDADAAVELDGEAPEVSPVVIEADQ